MIPGMGDLTNSGSMPISGGDATSGNGDQNQNNGASFGDINYGPKGVSPLAVVALVIVATFAVYKFKN